MANFTKYTSGFNIGGETIGIQAAKVDWDVLSTLTATSGSSNTSGIMTPDQIQALVSDKVASVYKVKGTKTRAEIAELEDAVNVVGDVYNVSDAGELPIKKDSETKITLQAGDNIVWTADGWDKLAASISLEGYAKEEWVNTNYSATRDLVTANSANWDSAYSSITGAVTVSGDMTDENKAKLAQVGAITGYVEDKIAETIAETINIVSAITTDTPTSAIPNVKAVTAYTDKYVTSAFGTVVVNDGTQDNQYEASAKNDTIKFVGGTNVQLTTTTDTNGNPTITINNTYEAPANLTITGGNGVTAALVPASEGVAAHYEVSGIAATTADAGITKAAYYDTTDNLIHLF